MDIVDVLSRIVHVATAIVLIGGTVFSWLILLPVARGLGETERANLIHGVTRRWKRVVHPGILLFLLTGFYNYYRAMPLHDGDGLYHGLIGTKMILALVIFIIASALVGGSPAMERIRQNRSFWMGVIVLLAAVIVAISGFVKVRGI